MKTAMQRLLELFEEKTQSVFKTSGTNDYTHGYLTGLKEAQKEIRFSLGEEKEQIIEAYYAGTAQFANDAEIVRPEGPEEYYSKTFTQHDR